MYNYFEFGYMDFDDGYKNASNDVPNGWIFEDMEARYERWPFMDNRLRDR